jgi:hypothetical protein
VSCKGLDAQVVHPQDAELSRLLAQFVPVRITNFKGIDLNRFRFDYDLTFSVLMQSADGATYSRFGSRDWRGSAERMSIAGLKTAMQAVLERHRAGAAKAPAPAGKTLFVQDYPAFAKKRQAQDACYHCHYANNARFDQLQAEGKFSKSMLFQYPYPENVGLTLNIDRNNVVSAVAEGSPAAKAAIRPGDVLVQADETPVLTEADLQFALNPVPEPGAVTLKLNRDGKPLPPVRLDLPKGWRKTDISWRPSQGEIAPTVGIWAEPLKPDQKQARGIPEDRAALRVSFFFPGPHWAKTRGSLQMNDVITGLNGKPLPALTTRQFHSHFRLNFEVGDTVTLNVLRGTQKLDIAVPCLESPSN